MPAFIRVAEAAEIPAGAGKLVEVAGKQIAVFESHGSYYAIDNECTHVGGPLAEGRLEGTVVECPWHAARFSIQSGQPVSGPHQGGVACYRVRRVGDHLEVEL